MRLDVAGTFSSNIAIDLGTANTLVHVAGRGIIIDEPSIVAVRAGGGVREIVAVGRKAKLMSERARESLEIVRPLREGVVADFVAAEAMLGQFIKRTKKSFGFRKPRILICIPAGATPVERRAVRDTAVSVGAREVHLIAEPVAASLGAGLPIGEADGAMVVDIGGGSTDIAVISNGEIVASRTLRCAGNAMDEAIIRYVRRQQDLLIGEASAERIKIEVGTAQAMAATRTSVVQIRGRDLRRGTAKTAVLTPKDVAEALSEPIDRIADFALRTLEELPPDVLSDITQRGIQLAGGGALLDKLDAALTRRVGVRFQVQANPMHCVIKGAAVVLGALAAHRHLLMRV
jgi:rod shape-determining protein MreB and related proteins